MIGDVDNVESYIMSHVSTNILCKELSGSNVIESIRLIGEEAKSHSTKFLKIMGKSINPALHAWVVIERVAVEVAELGDIPL